MNKIEIEKIKIFVNDVFMYEAVKRVLLAETEVDYTEIAKEYANNEDLGAKTRALAEGKAFIEKGFNKLQEFVINESKVVKKNRAI